MVVRKRETAPRMPATSPLAENYLAPQIKAMLPSGHSHVSLFVAKHLPDTLKHARPAGAHALEGSLAKWRVEVEATMLQPQPRSIALRLQAPRQRRVECVLRKRIC